MGFCSQHIGLNWHYIGFELLQLRMLAVVGLLSVGVVGFVTIMFVGSMM